MSDFLLQRAATRNPDDGKARLAEYQTLELDFEHDSTALTLHIPATAADPILLLNVILRIVDNFTGDADETLNVGDGATADAFIDELDIDVTAVNAIAQSLNKDNAKSMGWYYVADGSIVVTIGGAPTDGTGKLIAEIIRL